MPTPLPRPPGCRAVLPTKSWARQATRLICQKGARSSLGRADVAGRGQRHQGGSPTHTSSPRQHHFTPTRRVKMEKRRQFKTIASFPQLAGPGALQASPAAARTDPEEGGRSPPRQAPRDPAHPPNPPSGPPQIPWRPRCGERGGVSRMPCSVILREHERLRESRPEQPQPGGSRARHCPLSRSRTPRSHAARAPPRPRLSLPRPSGQPSQGSYWLLGLLNHAQSCRFVTRRGASAPASPQQPDQYCGWQISEY